MSTTPDPMDRFEIEAARLVREHPPQFQDRNKLAVLAVACPPGAVHAGRIGYTRWPSAPLPPRLGELRADMLELRPGYFDYRPVLAGPDALEWHLNFADPDLFGFYAGRLLAQDELQVLEHPALASLREALLARRARPRTSGLNGPTPVLVTGVERRIALDTAPDAAAGRPHGLYGNRFTAADPDLVLGAVRRLEPPTRSNILAINAPAGSVGAYTADQLRMTLQTAYSGFLVAGHEASRILGPDVTPRVAVHSGHWGGGAFGGDRTLMALVQLLAAGLAGVDRLVLHAGDDPGPVERAAALLPEIAGAPGRLIDEVLADVLARRFRWGTPDGN